MPIRMVRRNARRTLHFQLHITLCPQRCKHSSRPCSSLSDSLLLCFSAVYQSRLAAKPCISFHNLKLLHPALQNPDARLAGFSARFSSELEKLNTTGFRRHQASVAQ